MLVFQLKKKYDTKISELEKNTLIMIMTKILLITEFNTVAADFFNSRLAEANLIQRHILMLNTHVLMEKLRSIRRTC